MTRTITVFVGGSTSFNVRATLRNVGRMLAPHFDLHLVTVCPDEFSDAQVADYELHAPVQRRGVRGEYRALKTYFEDHIPDVVTQIGSVPVYGNMIARAKPRETTFVCRYSGDLFGEYRLASGFEKTKLFGVKNVLGRIPLRTADHIIAMGPREKKHLVDRGADPTAVSILPPPIDPTRLDAPKVSREQLGISSGRSIVLFVGRLSRLKGAATLERRIPEMLDRRDDLHFLLVGSQEYELSVPAPYQDHVTLAGAVPPDAVAGYYRAADVYVHPSLTEGISRSVLEAMLCETPVVVRDVGDLAYATRNFFTTEDEFVEMVCRYEDLPLDSPDRFTIESLQDQYVATFTNA